MQTWLMVGVAVSMIAIILAAGRPAAPARSALAAPPASAASPTVVPKPVERRFARTLASTRVNGSRLVGVVVWIVAPLALALTDTDRQ